MKECVDKMRITGRWQFPEELLQELEDLTATIAQDVASPGYMGAASSVRSSMGSPLRSGSSPDKGKVGRAGCCVLVLCQCGWWPPRTSCTRCTRWRPRHSSWTAACCTSGGCPDAP